MWRFTILVKRAENCSVGKFEGAWLDAVAPRVVSRAHETGAVVRSSINVAPPNLDPRLNAIFPPLFDGMAELWFDSQDAAAATLPQIARDGFGAECDTIDQYSSASWLAEARMVKPEANVTFMFTAAGEINESLGLNEARRYWAEEHPRVARTAPEVWDRLALYTQFLGVSPPSPLPGFFAPPRFVPMCSDMGFASQEDFVLLYASEQYRSIVRPDEEKFSQPGEMLAFATQQRRVQ